MRSTILWSLFATSCFLPGCATPMGQLNAPPKWCTAQSSKPQELKSGDDLIQKHADLKEANSLERAKNRCLRRYSNAVTGGQ
jgi:hypothetical protein